MFKEAGTEKPKSCLHLSLIWLVWDLCTLLECQCLLSLSFTLHLPPTSWGLHEIFVRHLDYTVSFLYKCIFIHGSVKWIFYYTSILFHFDICLYNKGLGSYVSHMFIHRTNLRDDYLSCLCRCVCLFWVVNQQIILFLDIILSVPTQQFWKNLQKKPFQFNTKQSFVDALYWCGHEETSWKAPMWAASFKKQVSTGKLPGLFFLI